TVKQRVCRPTVEEVIAVDPTEAVRSSDIMRLLRERFSIVHRADFGGTLLQFLLADIAGNFSPEDDADVALMRLLIQYEATLIAESVIPSDFTFIIARKKPN